MAPTGPTDDKVVKYLLSLASNSLLPAPFVSQPGWPKYFQGTVKVFEYELLTDKGIVNCPKLSTSHSFGPRLTKIGVWGTFWVLQMGL